MITVSIPVKSHVKKYISVRYGTTHAVSKKTAFGLFLAEMLTQDIHLDSCSTQGLEKYEVEVPEYYVSTKGASINRKKLKFLGELLEKLFYEELRSAIDRDLARGRTNAFQNLKDFAAYYQITENDIQLTSLYRNYQRYCGENIKARKHNNSQLSA